MSGRRFREPRKLDYFLFPALHSRQRHLHLATFPSCSREGRRLVSGGSAGSGIASWSSRGGLSREGQAGKTVVVAAKPHPVGKHGSTCRTVYRSSTTLRNEESS